MEQQQIKELMERRIRQILIHSCIYYRYNQNIVSDHQFDSWGQDLIALIKGYPEMLDQVEWGEAFKDYTETTSGFNLPFNDPRIVAKAYYVLKIAKGE